MDALQPFPEKTSDFARIGKPAQVVKWETYGLASVMPRIGVAGSVSIIATPGE